MKKFIFLALFTACGGAPLSPQPVDPVPSQFLGFLRSDAGVDAESLLGENVRFIEGGRELQGKGNVAGVLSSLRPPSDTLIDMHHNVARLSLPDGSLLFVRSNDGAITEVLRFASQRADQTPAPVKAYQDAWNLQGGREPKLQTGWAADGIYVDPTAQGSGRVGLSKVIDDFQRQFPGSTLSSAQSIHQLPQGWLTFDWTLTNGGSEIKGFDVGQLNEQGQLQFIAGFFSPR